MTKIYVRETLTRNTDGEELVVVRTYESKPLIFDYIVFVRQ